VGPPSFVLSAASAVESQGTQPAQCATHQRLHISLIVLAVAATGLAAFACGCGGSSPAPADSPVATTSSLATATVDAELLKGRWKPGASMVFDLPFVAPGSAKLVRFVRAGRRRDAALGDLAAEVAPHRAGPPWAARPHGPAAPAGRGVDPQMARR